MYRELSAIFVLLLTSGLLAKDFNFPAGHVYTSKTKLFTLKLLDGGTFKVEEESKKGDNAFEEVKLVKRGYAGLYTEAYSVGVRRLGRDVRAIVAPTQAELPPPALSYMALFFHFGGKIPGEPKPVSLDETTSSHGAGVVAISEVQNGSLIAMTTFTGDQIKDFAKGRVQPTRRPTFVASVTVRNGEYVMYASAQNDSFRPAPGTPNRDQGPEWNAQWQASVVATARGLLDNVSLLRPLDQTTFR
jgi:hypothetical protein